MIGLTPQKLFGVPVFVEHPRPRYTLPADVPPPPGMSREDFAEWSLRVCGIHRPTLIDGEVLCVDGCLHMNANTWAQCQPGASGGAQ